MIGEIAKQTNLYAMQTRGLEIKAEEVEQAIRIMLAMGIVEISDVRCYWAHETRCPPLADVMSKNKFLQLLQNLHFADNENRNIDKKQCMERSTLFV